MQIFLVPQGDINCTLSSPAEKKQTTWTGGIVESHQKKNKRRSELTSGAS